MRLTNNEVLFGWPLAKHTLTAGYYYSGGGLHRAIDLRAAVGTPVYAAEAGTVETAYRWNGKVTAGDTNSYGNMVKLRHADYRGGRLETLYAHLDTLCVTAGQRVAEGALLGYSGATGNVTGPHLHFEVRWKGERRNPLCWLDGDFSTASAGVYTYGGGEHPVERPAGAAPGTAPGTAADAGLKTYTVGPASPGDGKQIEALAASLGLGCTAAG